MSKTKLIQIRGSGGGKGGSGNTFEADDNMYARQSAAFVDAIAEGPIKGLVYGDASILVDEVRLRDVNQATGEVSETSNFNNFTMVTRNGTADQTVDATFFSDYPTASFVQEVAGAELLKSEPQQHSISSGSFEKHQTDYVKVTVSTTGMQSITKKGDNKGDIHTTNVYFNIDFWWVDNDGVLTKRNVFRTGFQGKVRGKYAHTFGFNIEKYKAINGMTDWSVRVTRTGGAESNDNNEVSNAIFVDTIEASISDKLAYPYTAYVGGVIDAEQFNSIPSRGYEIDGKLIQIPSNHFPIDYNGRKLGLTSASGFSVGDTLSQTVSVSSLTASGNQESGYTATATVPAHGVPVGKTFTADIQGVSGTAAVQSYWEGEFVCTSASATTFTYQLQLPWDESADSGDGEVIALSSTTASGTITAAMFSGGVIDKIVGNTVYLRGVAANESALTGAVSITGGGSGTIESVEMALIPANYRRNITTGKVMTNEQDWDGNFYQSWCNNPAWVFNDLITNKVYGLGNYLTQTQINKWELFQIGRYCDELVPAGVEAADLLSIHCTNDTNYIPSGSSGQHEPRFSANIVIAGKEEAYKVLNDVASIFRGMTYWLNGEAYLVQDSEKDPVYQFTNANVIDGMFKYEGTSNKTRTNSVTVSWNNPQDYYRKRVEIVELEETLQKDDEFIKPESTTAFGCTSRGQARRLGKWKLLTNNWNTNTVTFSTSLNAAFLRPGDIIQINDQNKSGKSWGGRISTSSSTTAINIDRKPSSFGDTSVESGYAAGDYMLTCSFVGYKALLAQDSAVIDISGTNTTVLRGTEISTWRDTDGIIDASKGWEDGSNDITIDSEEKAGSIFDTDGNMVYVQWTPFTFTETQTVSAVSNSGKTITVASAFSEAPSSDQIWVLNRSALATGKTKQEADLFRVMAVVENERNSLEITGLEYNASKFDAVDKNEALTQYRNYFLPDSLEAIPAPTNLDLTPRIVREGHQNVNELVFDWDPAVKSDGTPYNFIRGYDCEWSFDGEKWFSAGLSHVSDASIRGITSGNYYVRVYTVALNSKRSPVLEIGPIAVDFNRAVAPSEADIGLGDFTIPGIGNISTDFDLIGGKVTFENTNFYHNDGTNEHAVTSQAQLDFTGLNTAAGTRGAENVGYVYFDHSASAFIAVAHDEVSNQFYIPGNNTFAVATGTLKADPASAASKWEGLDSTNFDGELVLGNTFSFTNNSVTYYHKPKRFASDTEMYTHNPTRVKIVDGDNQAFNKPNFLADYQTDTVMGKVTRTGSGYTLQKYGNSQGESPYSVFGTNENFTFDANTDGTVTNESAFTCDFTVKKGTQTYTYAASGTALNTFGISLQSRVSFDNDSDIVISGSGQVTVGDTDMDAHTYATATLRLFDRGRADTVIADRILSFSKSSQGSDGDAAKMVQVNPSNFHMWTLREIEGEAGGGGITTEYIPNQITIKANTANTTADGAWSNSGGTLTSVVNTHTSPSCVVTSGNMADGMTVTYTLHSNDGSASDTVTLELLDAIDGGITTILTNEAHVLAASKTGAVSNYTGSGTDIKCYEGAGLMKFIASGTPGNGEWTVSVGNTANITEGSVSSSGSGNATYCTIGAHSGVATGTDSYAIYYTITGKSSKGTAFTQLKQQTITKSKTGDDGAAGQDGDDGTDGTDGAGIEYIFAITANESTTPSSPNNSWGFDQPSSPWFDGAPTVTSTNKALWQSHRAITGNPSAGASVSATWSSPVVVGRFGDDGADGQDGDDGAPGAAGTNAKVVYYGKTGSARWSTAPSAPSGNITSTSTGNNVWTTASLSNSGTVSVWQSNGTDASGSWVWSTPFLYFDRSVLDNLMINEFGLDLDLSGLAILGLTDSNYSNSTVTNALVWGSISVTSGSMVESWSTEDQSAYLPSATTQAGVIAISHPTLGTEEATFTWTRTGLNISGFALTNTGSGNDAWTSSTFGSAAASKTITVTHTASSKTIGLQAFVTDLSNLGGCLLPGSMISLPDGTTPIEEIEVGTKVIAYNETTGKEVEAEVLDKAPHKADFYYKVNDLQLTSGHPIWANDGWSCVDPVEYKRECIAYGHTLDLEPNKLEVGDALYNGTLVEKIERVDKESEVWNIIIKDIHTYIADDILVHNGGGGGGGKCLTPAMLPKGLQIGDEVESPTGLTKVVDVVYKEREGYYILEDELEITNDHPILIDGEWILAEEYAGKKEYIDKPTEVVYVETENELLTVKGWTVGGKY